MTVEYRFDFINRDGSVDTFDIGPCEDDGQAALRARAAMLVSLTAVEVEVWKDGSRICQVRRDAAVAHPPPVLRTLAYPRGDLGLGPTAFSRPQVDDFQPVAKVA